MAIKVEHGFLELSKHPNSELLFVKGSSIIALQKVDFGSKVIISDAGSWVELQDSTDDILQAIPESYRQSRSR